MHDSGLFLACTYKTVTSLEAFVKTLLEYDGLAFRLLSNNCFVLTLFTDLSRSMLKKCI